MYNFKQKLVGITSAASLLVGMFNMPGTGVYSYAEEAQKPVVASKSAGWTFGIYLCGQNLEENWGSSTYDLIEILKADVPAGFSKDNNFIVETGGCFAWRFKELYGDYLMEEKGLTQEEVDQVIPEEIDALKLAIYKINFEHEYTTANGEIKTIPALEFVKDVADYDQSILDEYYDYLDEDESGLPFMHKNKDESDTTNETADDNQDSEYANMGDSKYLKMFLDELDENYPAEHMAIDLWNHGGGITDGVCFDEYTDDGITIKELKEVLKSRIDAGKDKLDMVGFDACLMSNYETWVNISAYAEVGVGALTSEPGDGWYYTPFVEAMGKNYKDENYTAKELGSDIVDAYEEYYKAGGVFSQNLANEESEMIRNKLGHYKEADEEEIADEFENEFVEGEADAKLCAVDLDEIAVTSVKFAALGSKLLNAYKDKEGIKKIFDTTIEKGAIEYDYGYEFSGIDCLFDAIGEVSEERIPELSDSKNGLDKYAAECYKDAANYASELKEEINNSVINNYKGWENGDFYDAGAMSIYTPYVYPYSDLAYFNYGEYPEYSIGSDYARLMYLLASDLTEKSMDDVDMTPVYNYSSDDNKISIEYSDDAWYFIDQLAAFKFGKIDGKKYFFDSQYSNFIVGEPRVEMGVDSKYVTLTGAPMNVQSSQTEFYDEKTGEFTGEIVNLYSVDGKINDRSGILFFSDVSGEGLRFLTFVETSMLYDGYNDVDDEEKDKIVKRAVRKIHKDFEEDGEIDQENTDLDYDLFYSNDLKVGDKLSFETAEVSDDASFKDLIVGSEYGEPDEAVNKYFGNEYVVKADDLYKKDSYDENDNIVKVDAYSPELQIKEIDRTDVDVMIGSDRVESTFNEETNEDTDIRYIIESKELNVGKFRAFADADISVVEKEYELTGLEIKPEIVFKGTDIKFEEGKDYEVKYENNIGLGNAKITVKGIGGYDLIPEKTTEFKIVEVKKVDAKTGETKTVYVVTKTPKQAKIKSVKAKKKAFKVKWKKIKGVKGYEVKYALNKKFTKGKKVKTVSAKKTSLKVSKLKKKKYFVKVRAYTVDPNGEKVYGDWSKVKKVKVNK